MSTPYFMGFIEYQYVVFHSKKCCLFSIHKKKILSQPCPPEESNLYYKIRNLASYPLNEGGLVEKEKVEA